jgi:hypothetical protein
LGVLFSYEHGLPESHFNTMFDSGYHGGAYSPTEKRIYFAPRNQAKSPFWHYIDCETGAVVSYSHGFTIHNTYFGAVYAPSVNRIYFVPGSSSGGSMHYVDCFTGTVLSYTASFLGESPAYLGGVYAPALNRIYFVPFMRFMSNDFHYIDCTTNSLVTYSKPTTFPGLYAGGAYSPVDERIYFFPREGADGLSSWLAIDGLTGNPVFYDHGFLDAPSGYEGGAYSPNQNRIYFAPTQTDLDQPVTHYVESSTGMGGSYALNFGDFAHQAYSGGVYSPAENRIYFVPYHQSTKQKFHFVDCKKGTIGAYEHLANFNAYAYYGGVYSPNQNRIYFVPEEQANASAWHYIDSATSSLIAYDHHLPLTFHQKAYRGGVYSPNQNRIYFVPYGQAPQANWHYIDCDTGDVVAYFHGLASESFESFAYIGGVYSPLEDRIYFVPHGQAPASAWHYIDCATGDVVAYSHGLASESFESFAYIGGVYSPLEDRIYFVPHQQSLQNSWHYVDCQTGQVVAYEHHVGSGFLNFQAYSGGVYSFPDNRIYFTPHGQATSEIWHYIDCSNQTVNEYSHGLDEVLFNHQGFQGAAWSPLENRIYFIPYEQIASSFWLSLQFFGKNLLSPQFAAHPLFNSF